MGSQILDSRQGLEGLLKSWCDQETWNHAKAHNWSAASVYAHVHRLASSILSTKESLEDILGDLGDRATRDSKTSLNISPERLFMQASLSKRLARGPEYLRLHQGDYGNERARKFSRQRKLVFGFQAPMKSAVTKSMKTLVARGGIAQSTATICSCVEHSASCLVQEKRS